MRLGILSAVLPPYPCAESEFVFQLAEGLAIRGVSVTVITPQSSAASPDFEIKTGGAFLGTLSSLLKTECGALVVPYQPWLFRDGWWKKTLRAFCTLRPQVPVHLLYMNPTSDEAHEWKDFSLFSEILVLSERHRLNFLARFPALTDRTSVVPCFSLAPHPSSVVRRPSPPFNWITMGYLFPGKGIELLLRAFSQLHAKFPGTTLTVVGGTMSSDYSAWTSLRPWLELQAEALGIATAVEWISDFAQAAFPTGKFEVASAGVLSNVVGIGANNTAAGTLTQFELPLVAYRGDFLDPQFEEGHNCLLAHQVSSPALSAAMAQVQEDEALRTKLSEGAARLFKNHFSKQGAMESWLAILRRSKSLSGVYLKDGNPSLAPSHQPSPWLANQLNSGLGGAAHAEN